LPAFGIVFKFILISGAQMVVQEPSQSIQIRQNMNWPFFRNQCKTEKQA
jgi:hypothetical protein